MSLQIWLPLNGNLDNQGLNAVNFTNHGVTFNDSGKIGKCGDFNGSSYISASEKLIKSDKVSVCFWIYPNNVTENKGIVNGRNGSNKSFAIYMIGENIRVDTGNNWSTGEALGASIWTHVCFTSDGQTQRLYINGVETKSRNATFTYSTIADFFTIGCAHINGASIGAYFNGRLNDVRLYDHCLSPREVAEIAQGLVVHYPLSRPQENLLKNSMTNFPGLWSGSGDGRTMSTQSGVSVSEWGCTDALRVYGKSGASSALCLLINNSTHGLTVDYTSVSGQKYTPSIYVKNNHSTNAMTINFNGLTTEQSINPNEVKRVILDATGNGHSSLQFTISASGVNKDYDLTFWHPKIELGNIATPWIPAVGDTAYSVMGYNNNIVYDVSGYGRNITVAGDLSYLPDTPRYNTSINIPNTSTSSAVSPFTTATRLNEASISFWIKRTTTDSSNSMYIYNDLFQVFVHTDSRIRIKWTHATSSSSSTNTWAPSQAVTSNTWKHFVLTFKDGLLTIYVDGAYISQSDRTDTGQFILTQQTHKIWDNFGGQLSDLRVYTTALTADQVMELYNTPVSLANNGTLFGHEFIEEG